MNELVQAWRSIDRNRVAAMLSILPGAGHLYKHHYASGFGLLIGGNILVGFISVLMTFGTFLLSILVVPAIYIAVVAAAAYHLPDWHGRHHFLHPWRPANQEPEETSTTVVQGPP